MFYLRLLVGFAIFSTMALRAEEPKPFPEPNWFIYVLHLVPRLYDVKNWTEADKAAVDQHFNRLKEALKANQLFLAGRTSEPGDKTFGIVIFQARDENAARIFMESDPAVLTGVMTAELHPFKIALQFNIPVLERKNP